MARTFENKKYTLEELNSEWKDNKYIVSGFDGLEESSRTNIF